MKNAISVEKVNIYGKSENCQEFHHSGSDFPSKHIYSVAALRQDVTQGVKNPLWYGVPARLCLLREKAGLVRRDLSRMAGLADTYTSAIERSVQTPGIDGVEHLAAALGVPPGWLAYGDEGTDEFRQRRPRSPVPMDPPTPHPGKREPDGLYKGMGARCKKVREHRGLTLRAAARQAGISAQSLLLTEAGETVPLVSTCEALAGALFVSPVWLAYGYGVGVEGN